MFDRFMKSRFIGLIGSIGFIGSGRFEFRISGVMPRLVKCRAGLCAGHQKGSRRGLPYLIFGKGRSRHTLQVSGVGCQSLAERAYLISGVSVQVSGLRK